MGSLLRELITRIFLRMLSLINVGLSSVGWSLTQHISIMNQAELQKSSEGYSIATVGDLASFEGKAFVKDILNTTSMEVSFGTLAPGCTVPFFHHHKQNEEVYVVLSGEGVFILDGKEEPVTSSTIATRSLWPTSARTNSQ